MIPRLDLLVLLYQDKSTLNQTASLSKKPILKEIAVQSDNYNAGDIQKYTCSRYFIHFNKIII